MDFKGTFKVGDKELSLKYKLGECIEIEFEGETNFHIPGEEIGGAIECSDMSIYGKKGTDEITITLGYTVKHGVGDNSKSNTIAEMFIKNKNELDIVIKSSQSAKLNSIYVK